MKGQQRGGDKEMGCVFFVWAPGSRAVSCVTT